jgi:ATP-dependent Clp protease ATP-binding subunit ClpC
VQARVAIHVRGTSAVVATAVEFAEVSCGGPDVETALKALESGVRDHLSTLEPVDRGLFADEPAAELVRLPVAVAPEKGGEKIEIDIGVAVLTRRAKGREVAVAYVPVLPGFQVATRDRASLEKQVSTRVEKRLRGWTATQILAADEPSESRIVVLEVDVADGAGAGGVPSGGGILEEQGVDLTRADAGRIDRRDDLVRRVLETLAAPDRSSVLLVGPPDVGKTALVHEVGRRLALGEVPGALRGRRLWRLSANELIAGAQYTGQWQDRARRLIEQARGTRALCAMGDPVGIIDAGRWSGSDNNVSRYLRPYVESGELTLICECTPEQFAAAQKVEPSFVGAFHRVDVPEPEPEEARRIVAAAAARLADAAEVEVDGDAVDAAVELTRRYEPYRSFPGKALRLLEETVLHRPDEVPRIGREAVTAAFAARTGLPMALLSETVELQVAAVREHFETRVLGQPEATAAIVDLVLVLKAGLNDPAKPLGSFFFVGPTGVGKTELAKALAEFLFGSRDRVVRFDMGEYAGGDAVPRLIGSGWGGRDTDGELTRRVLEQPFSVVLLDEIEKAHWSVFDALLALLGEGRLTDASGRTADFRNTIVIMTSNLGASRSRSSSLGFGTPGSEADDLRAHYVEEAEKFFRPEFFNRIGRIVVYHPLGQTTVRQIARREIGKLLLREGIVRRHLLIEVDDAVVDALAARGFHPQYGARPLQREIERAVIEPLARLVVERRPSGRDFARVHLDGEGRVAVDIERIKEPKPRAERRDRTAERAESTLAKALRASLEFVERLKQDEAAEFALDLSARVSELVLRTHDADFWDDPGRARTTLQRIYRLEHVLDRGDSLANRAAGLTELARRLSEARDRSRVQEVWAALAEMTDSLDVVRLELAAAAASADGEAAALRVVPVGDGAADAWAGELVEMYTAWAERTAREVQRVSQAQHAIVIEGLATLQLLAAEAGLHRRLLADGTELLARVVISRLDAAPTDDEEDDPGLVVRSYEEGKHRLVRDPRTGIRENNLTRVLEEGRIDAFLLASLRRSPDEVA